MNVVFGAGGTGGHLFPALVVAQTLKERAQQARVTFIGIGSELERKLIVQAGFSHQVIVGAPAIGRGIVGLIRLAFLLPQAVWAARKLYQTLKPDLVVGFGGYPSFAPVMAAWLGKIPIILHEQNVQAGLANRVLSVLARKTFAVHGARGFFGKGVEFIDNPVRKELHSIKPWQAPHRDERFRLLVFGGSQGAKHLNEAILALNPLLAELRIEVIHQTGRTDLARMKQAYATVPWQPTAVYDFIENMVDAYAGAHLVICRAGAMTAGEISAVKRPAIFIPLPIAGGHQEQNVARLSQAGACRIVREGPGWIAELGDVLKELVLHSERLEQMVRALQKLGGEGDSGAERVVNEILRKL